MIFHDDPLSLTFKAILRDTDFYLKLFGERSCIVNFFEILAEFRFNH